MAHVFNRANDCAQPAVELAPARVTIYNRAGKTLHGQSVFMIESLELSFDNRLLRQIFDGAVHFFSDAYSHLRNKRSNDAASCLAKLGLNATVQDKGLEATFHYTIAEIRSLLQFLYCAIDLNFGSNQEVTFELKMAVLDLREAITPLLDDSEAVHNEINRQANRCQTRREAEEDIFGLD